MHRSPIPAASPDIFFIPMPMKWSAVLCSQGKGDEEEAICSGLLPLHDSGPRCWCFTLVVPTLVTTLRTLPLRPATSLPPYWLPYRFGETHINLSSSPFPSNSQPCLPVSCFIHTVNTLSTIARVTLSWLTPPHCTNACAPAPVGKSDRSQCCLVAAWLDRSQHY